MARNGAGTYSLPSGYKATTGEFIVADQHNLPLEDIRDDLNAARPIVAGGTGATTAAAARTALSVPSIADVQSGYVKRVATKTALKALDTATYKSAFLEATGTQLLFAYTLGDFTDEVAGDPGEELYIPADGIATSIGCWVAVTGVGLALTPISSGGTGSTTASAARTALGLEIDTDILGIPTYDPNGIAGDAFSMDNMAEGTNTKIMTADERTKLAGLGTGADMVSTNDLSDVDDANAALGNIGAGASFDTVALAEAFAPKTAPTHIRTAGYTAAGDGGGALYKKVASEPSHTGKFSITLADGTTVVWYELKPEGAVAPQMFGAVVAGGDTVAAANKVACEAALRFAADNDVPHEHRGVYPVTNVVLDTSGGLVMRGRGGYIGVSSGGDYDSLFEVKNCIGMQMYGDISLNCQMNATGYPVAFLAWTDGVAATAYNNWRFSAIANAVKAVQVGKATEPDWAISENNFHCGYFYNVFRGIHAIGAQCVLNVVNVQNIVLSGSGDGSWGDAGYTLPINYMSTGATITVSGGECIHTGDTGGSGVYIEPIASTAISGFENPWGKVQMNHVLMEISSPHLNTDNPDSLDTPTGGAYDCLGCRGVHSQDLAPLIDLHADFAGKVNVKDCDFFTSGTVRTELNIWARNDDCHIWVDTKSFGSGFLQGHAGITGGTLHFENVLITDVSDNGANTGTINGTVDLIYATENTDGDLGRWVDLYTNTTGVWTCPANGLDDVTFRVSQRSDQSTMALQLDLNGSVVAKASSAIFNGDNIGQLTHTFKSLDAGDVVKAQLVAVAAGTKNGTISGMQVIASKRSI